jgi:hypothetical protein
MRNLQLLRRVGTEHCSLPQARTTRATPDSDVQPSDVQAQIPGAGGDWLCGITGLVRLIELA